MIQIKIEVVNLAASLSLPQIEYTSISSLEDIKSFNRIKNDHETGGNHRDHRYSAGNYGDVAIGNGGNRFQE
jgi:hypothetical protein